VAVALLIGPVLLTSVNATLFYSIAMPTKETRPFLPKTMVNGCWEEPQVVKICDSFRA